ncbi:MAG TPA: S8 family serine peptidase [Myxococcaceae bacterium]|nr:S8 family serine peptidase [Myxococcaceae bacterium]
MTAHLFPLALLGAVATALTGCCERDTVAARAVNIDAPGVPAESDDVNVPVPGAIVVDFRDGTSKSAFDAWEKDWAIDLEFNSVEGEESGITVATGVDEVDVVLERIRQNPEVEAAEPLYLYQRTFVPNDPDYPKQWNLKLIDAEAAWDRSRGKGVIVAVLDTGIAWEDSGEFVRVPDLKGARFAKGYDFVNDDEGAHDDHGHGTHVAGTVAQVTHNREGVAGVAFEATLMPVKVLDHFGRGTAADISDAIRWAADHGAKVLNLSLGGPLRSEVMARAVEYARKKGATVVCAAGNSGSGRVSYPAAYPGAVAVSAVGPSGRLAPYSSWGKEIAIAAPGGDKRERQENGVLQNTVDLSDFRRPVYSYFQGTSMAAPHVSGVVALLYAAGASGPDEVEKALFAGARPVEGQKGRSEQYGHGLLNAKGALAALGAGPLGVDWNPLLTSLAMLVVVLLTLRPRLRPGYLNVLLRPAFLIPLVLATVGLFFLRSSTVGGFGGEVLDALSLPIPDWQRIIFGRGRLANPLFYSALLPVALSLVAIKAKSLRPVIGGLSLGFAAFLAYAAWAKAPALAYLPFTFLAIPWLVTNALVCLVVTRAMLKREAA